MMTPQQMATEAQKGFSLGGGLDMGGGSLDAGGHSSMQGGDNKVGGTTFGSYYASPRAAGVTNWAPWIFGTAAVLGAVFLLKGGK